MDLGRVDVVLLRPARAANVAAACRALKNMGLASLVIVGAPAGLDQPEARALAYGAWDVLDAAVPRATLREAVAGAVAVAGTSGRAHPQAWTPRRLAREGGALVGSGRLALVFGPEASGLTDEELAQCRVRVHIPADPAHASLNLAQAVLVVAYEMRMAAIEEDMSTGAASAAGERATVGELESGLDDLRQALLEIGYLSRDNPEKILSEWRALLARAGPTPREVSLLRGLARQIRWAAGHIARTSGGER